MFEYAHLMIENPRYHFMLHLIRECFVIPQISTERKPSSRNVYVSLQAKHINKSIRIGISKKVKNFWSKI